MKSLFLAMSLFSFNNFFSKFFNSDEKKKVQPQIVLQEGEELIYQKLWGNDKWAVIGKSSNGLVYQKCCKDKWTLVGKVEGQGIFQKTGKDRFTQIGKYVDGLIYQKVGKERYYVIGKYEDELIFQKLGRKDRWGVIGKSATPAEAALILLLSSSGDAAIFVMTAI
jgi:hypothetical protein